MKEFINGLLNGEFSEMSADDKAQWFADLLNKIFEYVAKVMGI